MREQFSEFDSSSPLFHSIYKLGDCLIKDCGCIIEHRTKGGIIWDCPEHTQGQDGEKEK
jgi:hypothetical protein